MRLLVGLVVAAAVAWLAACDGQPPAQAPARKPPTPALEKPTTRSPAETTSAPISRKDADSAPATASLQRLCANGIVVPDPQQNPGLVQDCAVLLALRDTLAGTAPLNWSSKHSISNWWGVRLGGRWSVGPTDRVTDLVMTNFRLTGSIPAGVAELTELRTLDLSTNQLKGWIPPELGRLVHLEEIYLAENRLIGPIPRRTRLTGQSGNP